MADWRDSILSALAQGGAQSRDLEDLRFVDVPDAEGYANMAGGVASGTAGMPGDLEMLVRLLADLKVASKGGESNFYEDTTLPTTEDVGDYFGMDTESTGFQSGTFLSPDAGSKFAHLLPALLALNKIDLNDIKNAGKMLRDMPQNPWRQQEALEEIESQTGLVALPDRHDPSGWRLNYHVGPGSYEHPDDIHGTFRAGDVYENPELAELVPQYKDIKVEFDPTMTSNEGGAYIPNENRIMMNPNTPDQVSYDNMDFGRPGIFAHEVDHGVNHMTHNYTGSNPGMERFMLNWERQRAENDLFGLQHQFDLKPNKNLIITPEDYTVFSLRARDAAELEIGDLLQDFKSWDGTRENFDEILLKRQDEVAAELNGLSNVDLIHVEENAQRLNAIQTARKALKEGESPHEIMRYLLRTHGNPRTEYNRNLGEGAANVTAQEVQLLHQDEPNIRSVTNTLFDPGTWDRGHNIPITLQQARRALP